MGHSLEVLKSLKSLPLPFRRDVSSWRKSVKSLDHDHRHDPLSAGGSPGQQCRSCLEIGYIYFVPTVLTFVTFGSRIMYYLTFFIISLKFPKI